MQRLSGEAELAPQAKADLQQFVSMFDGECRRQAQKSSVQLDGEGGKVVVLKDRHDCPSRIQQRLICLCRCPADKRVARAGWMDGQGNVREGTHFLFSTTPEGHLVTEGGRVLYLVVALPGGGAVEMALRYGQLAWLQSSADGALAADV